MTTPMERPRPPRAAHFPEGPGSAPSGVELEAVFDTAPLGMIYLDTKLRVVRINQYLASRNGLSAAEHVGRRLPEILPELAPVEILCQRVLAEGRPALDIPFTTLMDGVPSDWTLSYYPVRDAAGEIIGLSGIVQDVTERNRLKSDLERQQRQLESLIENIPDMLFRWDRAFRFIYASPRVGAGRGIPPDAWLGKTAAEMGVPDYLCRKALEVAERVFHTGLSEVFEAPLFRRNKTAHLEARVIPEFGPDGDVESVLWVVRDVTEQADARRALRESEERFRLTLQTANITVFQQDLELRYTWLQNPAPGFKSEDILGKTDDVFRGQIENFDAYMSAKRDVLLRGRGRSVEVVVRNDAGLRYHELRVEPLRDPSGTVVGITGASVEVTERHQAEDALRDAKEAAEKANAAKDHFLAALSHELRTPLNPVLMTTNALEKHPAFPRAFRDDLTLIRRNVELEARLIDDLLDLTRVSRGKLRLQPQQTDVHQLLRYAIDTCCGEPLEAKGIELHVNLDARNARVEADPARLQQVLWNLLNNAVKFTPEGGRITITTRNDARQDLVMEVRDTGIGMDEQTLPRLFRAFEQGDAAITRKFGGLGMGLAIAKAIVDLHGGSISAASPGKNRGSTFTLVLPTTDPDAVDAPADAPAAAPPVAKPTRPLHILLVEDHHSTAHVLGRLLRLQGHAVTVAGTAAAAGEALAREKFDLAISDLGLPDASGLTLMPAFKAKNTPAIAVSGFGTDDDLAQSAAAGFSAHLTKPIDFDRLLEVIRALMPNP